MRKSEEQIFNSMIQQGAFAALFVWMLFTTQKKNGVFSYTFTAQAVSTSDDWTAYFVMEKSTERMSTPDIRITLRRDV
ncbi:hypothetical protein ACUODJ_59340, partial [Escherichia sp. HC-CC]